MNENRLAADLDHVLDHTRGLWEDLRGERIFFTGGTGFFGCWLLESFAWANDRLGLKATALVLTRDQDRFHKKAPHLADNPAINFQLGDVRSFDFPGGTFPFVIHAATDSSTPTAIADTVLAGTYHVADFAQQCQAKNLLLTSSGAVYDERPPEISHISEDYPARWDPKKPRTTKFLAEQICVKNVPGTKIARCFAFVGPYLPLDSYFAIGNFIRDGLNGGPILVKGDGTAIRSYLYGADLAIWLWTILFKAISCKPYNVGSEKSMSILEIARSTARQFHSGMEVKILGKPDLTNKKDHYVPSTSRASTELGLHQIMQFEESLVRTKEFTKWKDYR